MKTNFNLHLVRSFTAGLTILLGLVLGPSGAQADFTNVTIPGVPGVWMGSATWADFDNDGRLDFLLTGQGTNTAAFGLWKNTGSGFSNETPGAMSNLLDLPLSSLGAAAWGDYDNDGRLDVLIPESSLMTRGPGQSLECVLWRNGENGFSNVMSSLATGLPRAYPASVGWGDYDNDGRQDFLLAGTSSGLYGDAFSQIWRNTGKGFRNVTSSIAASLSGVVADQVVWADYDNDGRLDFLLTGVTTNGTVSQLWRNTVNGFTNVTASAAPGLPGVWDSSVAWGDYDNDGRLDFLITGHPGTGDEFIAQIWHNTGSAFSNATASVAPGLPRVRYGTVA